MTDEGSNREDGAPVWRDCGRYAGAVAKLSDTRGAAHAGWQSEPHRESAARVGWKPDLSGVWHAEYASVEENRRLFGDSVDEFAVPGDDPGTFSKYSLNILIDFKPEDSPMRPETVELLKQNAAKRATDAPTLGVFLRVYREPNCSITSPSRLIRRRVR